MEGTFFSLIPPLVAILLCIWLRDAIISLLAGVFIGALILHQFDPWTALLRSFDEILLASFVDEDHAINLFFVVLIGGLVEIMNRSEATKNWISFFASKIRRRAHANVAIWCAGMVMFIDDYANALLVGNGFRKFADRLRVSREKLAFLVDTTAAPITSIALISTWIGFEISVIQTVLVDMQAEGYSGYGLFFASLPYRFYPVLMLIFCLMLAWSGRDYGPMLRAERRVLAQNAAPTPTPDAPEAEEADYNPAMIRFGTAMVFLPFVLLTTTCLVFLVMSGFENGAEIDPDSIWQTLINIFTETDAFRSILWATVFSTVASFVIHLAVIRESYRHVVDSWMAGCQTMFVICVILVLAWSIGAVCRELETGVYIASLLGEDFNPALLPLFTFLAAAGISFATGTSYGTMAILFPITLPLALQFADGNLAIIYGTVGSVLGGAIFGDHCSPISDTTILSAGASGCSVADHVNTQIPYALTVGIVATLCLWLLPWVSAWWLNFGALALLAIVLFGLGRTAEDYAEDDIPVAQAVESESRQ